MAGTTADIAIIGGRKYWAGGPYSGQPVDSTPANAGDLTPYLTPSYTRQLAPQTQMPAWAQAPASGGAGGLGTYFIGGGGSYNEGFGGQRGVTDPGFGTPGWGSGGQSSPRTATPTPPWMQVASGQMSGGGFNPGNAFGPGKATLPSMQRWGRLAPTERQGMQGYWSDQLGVDSNDVFGLMNKLKPQGAVGSAPRWM